MCNHVSKLEKIITFVELVLLIFLGEHKILLDTAKYDIQDIHGLYRGKFCNTLSIFTNAKCIHRC